MTCKCTNILTFSLFLEVKQFLAKWVNDHFVFNKKVYLLLLSVFLQGSVFGPHTGLENSFFYTLHLGLCFAQKAPEKRGEEGSDQRKCWDGVAEERGEQLRAQWALHIGPGLRCGSRNWLVSISYLWSVPTPDSSYSTRSCFVYELNVVFLFVINGRLLQQ